MQELPKIVVKRIAAGQGRTPHPDADLLTAFAEQSLRPIDRMRVMQHLAACSDCRDVLALASPEIDLLPAVAQRARLGWVAWLNRPAFRFGLVTAGAIAIASVGFLQYRHHELRNVGVVAKVDAPGSIPPENVQPENKDTAMHTNAAAPASSVAALGAIARQSDASSSRPELRATLHTRSPLGVGGGLAAEQGPPAVKGQASPSANANLVVMEASSERPEVTAQNQPQDQLIQKQQASSEPFTNADVVKAKAAATAQSAAGAAPTFVPPSVTSLQTAPALMSRASPLWTINSAGALQRSFDAGKTWELVNPTAAGIPTASAVKKMASSEQEKNQKPAKSPEFLFRAVSAIGPEVWAGGSAGILYHSGDSGTRWQQVPFSPDASPTGDIVTIQFSDPQHGRVSTSTSEVWTTADNGQTWQKQQ
jgi:hypothetical protein